MPLHPDDKTDLERMVDHSSLSDVIDTLSEICDGKADHLQSNWQDKSTAKLWERAAIRLNKIAFDKIITAVS